MGRIEGREEVERKWKGSGKGGREKEEAMEEMERGKRRRRQRRGKMERDRW